MELKKEIRKEVRRRVKELSDESKQAASMAIFDAIEQMSMFNAVGCVALFAAMGDEVPTRYALGRWPALGKRVVVPRVEGDVMRFYDYSPDRMQTGAFGIEEPVGDVECPASDIDLIIVPARAFTRRGERLGRGGGFYDKYMSLPGFRAHKTGICFECQIFDELPIAEHDILVDEVVAR
jgi:5-formyltetrahydrofolate cyclo-ligase